MGRRNGGLAARAGRREILLRCFGLLVLLLPGIAWFPADAATPTAGIRSGALLLRSDPDESPHEALRVATRIQARVSGNVARVRVTQEFENASEDWVEGLYVFPLSADAAVDELEMQFGDRVIRGEIRPREEAREVYETARREGRRASLLDQERPNMFTASVANIPPRARVTVGIAYLEAIPWRDARYSLKLPLAVTPRYTPGLAIDATAATPYLDAAVLNMLLGTSATPERVASPDQAVDIEIELAPGFELASLESLHHPVSVEETGGRHRLRLASERVPADRDFELNWTPRHAPDTQAAVFTERVGEEIYALVMLMPPEAPAGEAPPRELLFVIDTSGSMGGAPIRQARAALELGVARLGPGDRFNVIRFSSDASQLFPAPRAATPGALDAARRYIASLEAGGGTEMRAALELALATPPPGDALRQVVFITDGSVANEAELVAMIARRIGDARLFTVGIGAAPNAWFMQEAAAAGRGSYTFIAEPGLVAQRMAALFRKLENPALVELELHWPGAAEAELAAPMPRDLYAGDPLLIAARLPREPQGVLTLGGRSRTGAWVHQLPFAAPVGETGIAKLWARERIAELSRRKRLGGTHAPGVAGLDAQVQALALEHGLVSELTSLVAVDVTPVRPAGMPDRLAQAAAPAPAGTAWARSAGFPATATSARLWLLAGAGSLSIAGLLGLFGAARVPGERP
jgi:Ca-activated chloride channel homolog